MEKDSQIFRPNKLKCFLLFLGSSAFVAMGFLILDSNPKAAWASIVFFGFGVIVALIQFFPNVTYLKLTNEGFEVKGLFRSSFTRWTDIKDIGEGHVKGSRMIFFDYTDKHRNAKRGKGIAKFLLGNEGALQSIYDIKTEKLLELMNEYKSESDSRSAQS